MGHDNIYTVYDSITIYLLEIKSYPPIDPLKIPKYVEASSDFTAGQIFKYISAAVVAQWVTAFAP